MVALPLRPSVFDCRACPLAQTRTHIVDGAGPLDAPLIIVGEAPGADEDKVGLPFVGRSGKLLRASLSVVGLTDGYYYLTNVVKCRPPDNRNPEQVEIDTCACWLAHELENVKGRVLLALGKFAQAAVTRLAAKGGLPEDMIVRHAHHPAYILRSPRNRAAWERDISDAADLALGRTPARHVPTPKPWSEGTPRPDAAYFAADTETDDLIDSAYGVRRVAWTASDGKVGMFQTFEPYLSLVKKTWMHNAKYDAPLLGIDLRKPGT